MENFTKLMGRHRADFSFDTIKATRLELEQKTGKKVVTSLNAKTSLKGKDTKNN